MSASRQKRSSNTLGSQRINNISIKGRELLYLYKTNNLRNILSYFKQNNYIMYRSFNDKKLAHMWTIVYAEINDSK